MPERAGASDYGREFGRESSAHHFAAVTGPLLAFGLLALAGTRTAFLAAAVPGFLAFAVSVWVLRREARPASRPAARPALQTRAVYQGPLGRLMVGISLFEVSNFAAVLLILRATKLLEDQGDAPSGRRRPRSCSTCSGGSARRAPAGSAARTSTGTGRHR